MCCLQSSRAVLDELLLDIYSSINEPDSIYAVARGHNMMSQLKLYEHEGSWDKALTGYDLLCRRTLPAAVSTSQAASSSDTPSESSAYGQQGLLTSLQQLGCRHLIEAYWQGQPASLSPGLPHHSLLPTLPLTQWKGLPCKMPSASGIASDLIWQM